MKVVLATGGTGGHIYPAIALCKEILKDENNDVLFIGTTNRMESNIIPTMGYKYYGIEVVGFNGASQNKLQSLKLITKAIFVCKKKLKEYKPDVVIGFGNYITIPVLIAAKLLGIKTMIHEQNSVAGLANKVLGKIVDKIVISYPDNDHNFNEKKTLLLGNPRASQAYETKKDDTYLPSIGLDETKKTVLIVMGSLGSSSVNDKLLSALELAKSKDYQIIYVTGKEEYENFLARFTPSKNIKVLPYIEQIKAMRSCDLIVSRGGATSASEITVMGLPAIIIPSPFVTNDHQHKNALALQKAGCAIEIREPELTGELLIEKIDDLFANEDKLKQMHDNSSNLGFPSAAKDMVELIRTLIGE